MEDHTVGHLKRAGNGKRGKTMTYEQAVIWAKELGIKIRANDQAVECWIDRVHRAGFTGKPEDIEEANRYSGRA
jgi:hypothetical protein